MIITFHEPQVRTALLLWGVGTLYMCLFALFVGMTRQYILRKGTLFFIRSPDDPNTRLVHDALMKPFHIQIWRISQSALVYTLFITVGIGGITHGLKAMGSQLIPVRVNFFIMPIPTFWLTWIVIENMSLLKKYVRQYWTRAFKACAAQLRLSSFILGKHDPRERGHIVYRNMWTMIQGAKPDYTQPTTTDGAKEVFDTTDAKAVFVPDGYHVRAPKFDMASRRYIRTLFVPVTKDDIPLNAEPARPSSVMDIDLDDDSGEEDNRFDEYEVVYRPPNFGIRIIGLIAMLCVFAVILFTGSIIASNVAGRPFAFVFEQITDYIGLSLEELAGVPQTLFNPQLDLGSIVIGLFGVMLVLKKYDERVIRQHLEGTHAGQVANARHRIRMIRMLIDVTCNLICFFFSIAILVCWCFWIHRCCADSLYYFTNAEHAGVMENALHFFLAAFYSVRPLERAVVKETNVQNARQFGVLLASPGLWKRLARPVLVTFASSFLIIGILQSNVVLYEYLTNPSQYRDLVDVIDRVGVNHEAHRGILLAITPFVVGGNLIYKLLEKAASMYRVLNAQVKEQYYSRGKTLENAQVEDRPAVPTAVKPAHDANEDPVEEPLDP